MSQPHFTRSKRTSKSAPAKAKTNDVVRSSKKLKTAPKSQSKISFDSPTKTVKAKPAIRLTEVQMANLAAVMGTWEPSLREAILADMAVDQAGKFATESSASTPRVKQVDKVNDETSEDKKGKKRASPRLSPGTLLPPPKGKELSLTPMVSLSGSATSKETSPEPVPPPLEHTSSPTRAPAPSSSPDVEVIPEAPEVFASSSTNEHLAACCAKRTLKVGGSKSDKIARLRAFTDGKSLTPNLNEEQINTAVKSQLVAWCAKYGILTSSSSGMQMSLLERIGVHEKKTRIFPTKPKSSVDMNMMLTDQKVLDELSHQLSKATGSDVIVDPQHIRIDDDEIRDCMGLLVEDYETAFKSGLAKSGDGLLWEMVAFTHLLRRNNPPQSKEELSLFIQKGEFKFHAVDPSVDSVQLFFEWKGTLQKNKTFNVFCESKGANCTNQSCCPKELFYRSYVNYLNLVMKAANNCDLKLWVHACDASKAWIRAMKKRQLENNRTESGSAMWELQDVEELDALFADRRRRGGSLYDRTLNAQYALIFGMLVHGPQRGADVVKYLNAYTESSTLRGVEWTRIAVPNEKSRKIAVMAAFKSGEKMFDVPMLLRNYLSLLDESNIRMTTKASAEQDTSVSLFPELYQKTDGSAGVRPNEKFEPGNIETSRSRWPCVSVDKLNAFLTDQVRFGLSDKLRVHGLRGSKAYLAYKESGDPEVINKRMGWQPNSNMHKRYARIAQMQAMNAPFQQPVEFKEMTSFNWKHLDA
jgi:hypothetical protein